MMLRKNIFKVIYFLALFLALRFHGFAETLPKLIVFHSPSCHRCIEVKSAILPEIEKEYKGRVDLEYRDIGDIENYKLMLALKEKYNPKIELSLPVFFIEGRLLNGKGDVRGGLKALIDYSLSSVSKAPQAREMDLLSYFKTFTPLAIASAGLIDGINPCAFTVIVFFISFLALQGYRKRELISIGLSFILSVFATYLLLGIGIFNFLYQIKGFWRLITIVNVSIGVFSIILGILAVYDFIKFRKTGKTEGLLLQLPQSIKNKIHYVVGLHYRKTKTAEPQEQETKKHVFMLCVTALSTGLIVSLLEAVCTGQTYLPTIAFILKTANLKLQAAGYLLLYNFMFIVPLLAIFLFALFGVSSEQFSLFLKKRLSLIKILMALLFFSLGIFLLCYAETPDTKESQEAVSKEYTWDFGSVKEGEIFKHAFIFWNKTSKEINIKEVHASCGCTVAQVKKKKVLPGRQTAIDVKFNSKGYSGKVTQFVYVHTDDVDNPILRYIIKAEVVPRI